MKSKNLRYGFFLALLVIATALAVTGLVPGATRVEGMALSPNGETLAVCLTSFDNDLAPVPSISNVRHWIRLYDASNWKHRDIEGEVDDPIAFSPDGKYFATADQSRHEGTVVLLWDAGQPRVIATMRGPADPTGKLAPGVMMPGGTWSLGFSPDSAHLVAAGMSDPFARVWTVPGGETVAAMQHEESVQEVRFSPDGRHLFTAGDDGAIRVWDYRNSELRGSHFAHKGGVRTIEFSHDGKALASGGRDGTLAIWDLATMTVQHRLGGPNPDVDTIAFSPDDRIVAAGIGGGGGSTPHPGALAPEFSIALCSVAKGTVLSTLEGHSGYLSFVFSADGDRLISGGGSGGMLDQSPDGTIRVWDVATGSRKSLIRPTGLRLVPLILCCLGIGLWLHFWIRGIRRGAILKPFRTILIAMAFVAGIFTGLIIATMIWFSL